MNAMQFQRIKQSLDEKKDAAGTIRALNQFSSFAKAQSSGEGFDAGDCLRMLDAKRRQLRGDPSAWTPGVQAAMVRAVDGVALSAMGESDKIEVKDEVRRASVQMGKLAAESTGGGGSAADSTTETDAARLSASGIRAAQAAAATKVMGGGHVANAMGVGVSALGSGEADVAAPHAGKVFCRTVRSKAMGFTTYRMFYEETICRGPDDVQFGDCDKGQVFEGAKRRLIFGAKKVKLSSTSNYHIFAGSDEKTWTGKNYIAKLRKRGSGYIYELNDAAPHLSLSQGADLSQRRVISLINAGFSEQDGLRNVSVVLPEPGFTPETSIADEWAKFEELGSGETMQDKMPPERIAAEDASGMLVLHTKKAQWDDKRGTWSLKFEGRGMRAKEASTKNFMLVDNSADSDPTKQAKVYFQLAKIEPDSFSCDFREPITSLLAFSIALAVFDSGT